MLRAPPRSLHAREHVAPAERGLGAALARPARTAARSPRAARAASTESSQRGAGAEREVAAQRPCSIRPARPAAAFTSTCQRVRLAGLPSAPLSTCHPAPRAHQRPAARQVVAQRAGDADQRRPPRSRSCAAARSPTRRSTSRLRMPSKFHCALLVQADLVAAEDAARAASRGSGGRRRGSGCRRSPAGPTSFSSSPGCCSV